MQTHIRVFESSQLEGSYAGDLLYLVSLHISQWAGSIVSNRLPEKARSSLSFCVPSSPGSHFVARALVRSYHVLEGPLLGVFDPGAQPRTSKTTPISLPGSSHRVEVIPTGLPYSVKHPPGGAGMDFSFRMSFLCRYS